MHPLALRRCPFRIKAWKREHFRRLPFGTTSVRLSSSDAILPQRGTVAVGGRAIRAAGRPDAMFLPVDGISVTSSET